MNEYIFWRRIAFFLLILFMAVIWQYQDIMLKNEIKIQNASLNGYNLARSEIVSITVQCQQYPIIFTDSSEQYKVTLVALECLQRGEGE